MRKNVRGKLTTKAEYISTLVADIRKGEIKVPQFQRGYVWSEQQALELLDSLASNYPIGSLLIWKTHTKMRTERNIGNFALPATEDLDPTDYVLDGQQRLTVIYSCLGAPESTGGFAAAYDLETEEFIKLPSQSAVHIFPLRRYSDSTKLLDFRQALRTHRDHEELDKRFVGIFDAITKYLIPVVTLTDLTVEEVCPIFERVNSSGTKLSTYDLMVAATWSQTFDLNEVTEKIKDALGRKGFEDIDGGTVLKCLSAIESQSVKRTQVFSLRKLSRDQMVALAARTQKALLKAVDLLTTEFRVYSWDFLPYEAQVIILSDIYAKKPELSQQQVSRVGCRCPDPRVYAAIAGVLVSRGR